MLGVALAATLVASACGTSAPKGTEAKNIKQLPADAVSGTFLGLTPHLEDLKDRLQSEQGNSYVSGVGLYSLRKGDELEATLQLSKLSKTARPKDEKFQQLVAGQIGGTKVQPFVMGGRTVYRSSLRKQSLTSWFTDDYFMILSVRETYKTPRALLRVLLKEVNPK
ncbi:MAG: hypothetical protein QOJ00_1857 [Actinomycetota bacterium]